MTVPYLTEDRLRVLGFVGEDDISALSDAEIRNLILYASATVDAWCGAPRIPQPYSFRGGDVVDEQHDWFPGDGLTPPQRRVFVSHGPLKSCSAFRIYVTPTMYTDFLPGELFISKQLNAIEIISFALTSVAPLGAFVLPNIGLEKPQVFTSYSYGYEFKAVDEILDPTDAWQYRAGNQFWDSSAVTVKVNGDEVTSGFTIDRIEGTITFDAAQDPDALVQASYGYSLPQEIAYATGIIAHDAITERQLHDKGLGNIQSIRVGEITLDRGRISTITRNPTAPLVVPHEAEVLLTPFRFVTLR